MNTEENRKKKFMLIIDEMNVGFLSRLAPSIEFVEVEGMNMQGNETHMALVSPILKKEEPKVE